MKIPLTEAILETTDKIIELTVKDFYSKYHKCYMRIKDGLVLVFGIEVCLPPPTKHTSFEIFVNKCHR